MQTIEEKRKEALVRGVKDEELKKKKLKDHRKLVWKDEQDKQKIKK